MHITKHRDGTVSVKNIDREMLINLCVNASLYRNENKPNPEEYVLDASLFEEDITYHEGVIQTSEDIKVLLGYSSFNLVRLLRKARERVYQQELVEVRARIAASEGDEE